MSYQDTERELLTLGKMRVRLSREDSLASPLSYGVECAFVIGGDSRVVDVKANFNCFPATSRVAISDDITSEIMKSIDGTAQFSRQKILLAVFSTINEAYLSYTEELIMEAKPEKDELKEMFTCEGCGCNTLSHGCFCEKKKPS